VAFRPCYRLDESLSNDQFVYWCNHVQLTKAHIFCTFLDDLIECIVCLASLCSFLVFKFIFASVELFVKWDGLLNVFALFVCIL